MFVFPQNLHVEGLIPNVMAFGRCLGLDKVTRIGPHDGIGVLVRKERDQSSLALSSPRYRHSERCHLQTRKRNLTGAKPCWAPAQPPELCDDEFLQLSHPVCGTFIYSRPG